MTIEIRPVTEGELPAWVDVLAAAFLGRVDAEAIAKDARELWDPTRAWGAFEGQTVVGTNRTWATELTVPGGASCRRPPCPPWPSGQPIDGAGSCVG